jgi:phospholipase C
LAKAEQLTASDTKTYSLTPAITGAYKTLLQPNTTYVAPGCDGQPTNIPGKRFPADLPNAPYEITKYVPYFDDHLQYTGGCEFYGPYVGDPLHRFYQMAQQTLTARWDSSATTSAWRSPATTSTGCLSRLTIHPM